MARRKRRSEAFDISLSAADRERLTSEWVREIQDALAARAAMIQPGGLIDLFDWFYEQGKSDPADLPFPGAADLTSYFITENVDALHARIMKAITSVEPFCIVEGWGSSAPNAPFVEEFHDWQVDEEGLEEELDKVIQGALIEDCQILEVRERVETRRIVEQIDVALETDPETGGAVFDAGGRPKLRVDGEGEPIEPQEGEASAKVERTHTKTRRLGPEYDVISMRDFVFLPGHARNKRQVWGYAYRFHLRMPEIQERVDDRIYDKTAASFLSDQSDRNLDIVPTPSAEIAPQEGPSVEKELWQLSIKRDLDGDGREEWYLATLSVKDRTLLRLKLDTFVMKVGKPRCVPFILFPRRNAVYGYSYAGDKLLTLAEEHTGLRNMKADRGALATNAPMTVLQNAMFDPDEQPFGVGRFLTVRSHDEIKQLQVADVPAGVVEQERALVMAKERVGGLSDMSVGVNSAQQRTLGENQMVATGSAIRVDKPVAAARRALAVVMELRHQIWIDTLEADQKGMEAPESVVNALQLRGAPLEQGRFTAAKLKGRFKFKPWGSSETADRTRNRADFNNGLIALANIAKVFPGIAQVFQSQDAAKAIVEEWARVYSVRNRQAFLGVFQQAGLLPQGGGMNAGGAPAEGADPMATTNGVALPEPLQQLIASLSGGGSGAPMMPDEGMGMPMMGEGY